MRILAILAIGGCIMFQCLAVKKNDSTFVPNLSHLRDSTGSEADVDLSLSLGTSTEKQSKPPQQHSINQFHSNQYFDMRTTKAKEIQKLHPEVNLRNEKQKRDQEYQKLYKVRLMNKLSISELEALKKRRNEGKKQSKQRRLERYEFTYGDEGTIQLLKKKKEMTGSLTQEEIAKMAQIRQASRNRAIKSRLKNHQLKLSKLNADTINKQKMCTKSITRSIGKHNSHVIILDHGQDVMLWDWTLLNAIKAEDDKNHSLLYAYMTGTYKGSFPSQIKISQKANSKCVALLQSSLSEDAIHLIMDLHDASNMRKRLLDVYGNTDVGGGEKMVLLLLQFQQGKLNLQEYLKEMKRRIEVCRRFGIHLSKVEQIQAIILGLSSAYDESRKNIMTNKLTDESPEADRGNEDYEIRCVKQIFDWELRTM